MDLVTGLILLVVGVIACFFGRRFYRIVLALLGFGYGYYLISGLLGDQSEVIQIVGGVVGGAILGYVFWTFYKFGYVIIGALLGLIAAAVIGTTFNLDDGVYLLVALVLLVVGALVGNALADPIIRLGTAFSGAAQIIGGIAAIAVASQIDIPLADPTHGGATTESTAGIITLVAVIMLGVVGFLYQSRHDAGPIGR